MALALLTWLLLGAAQDLPAEARMVAAIGVLMATWWVTEAIPLSATALLPVVLFPAFGVVSVGDTTARYGDPIVFLFLGGFLIAIAMQKWHLHRRIALLTLRTVGTTPTRIVLGMMVATAFLSMWVSKTATTLMMLPIALSVLALVAERAGGGGDEVRRGAPLSETIRDPAVRSFGIGLVLSVAWASSIGGLGTLLGSPPNAIVAGYVQDELDRDISFVGWMQLGVPIVVVFVTVAWLLITRVLFRTTLTEIPGGREMIDEQLREMGPASTAEKRVLAVFASAAFLWIVPGLLTEFDAVDAALPWLGGLNDTAIAIAAGIALFFLPSATTPPDEAATGRRGGGYRMLLAWPDAQAGLPWGVLLLFGGGLALAGAVASSGLDEFIGTSVAGLGVLPVLLLVAAVVTIVLFLTRGHQQHRDGGDVHPGARRGRDRHRRRLDDAAHPGGAGRDLRVHAAGRHPAQRHRLRVRRGHHRSDGPRRAAAQRGRRPADHRVRVPARRVGAGPAVLSRLTPPRGRPAR